MLSPLFPILSAFLLVLSHIVSAAPVQPVGFLAIAPNITAPTNGAVWTTGSTQTVKWETDNIPAAAQGYTVTILLGHVDNGSENLDIKNPLASQIPIMDGSTQITVPIDISYRTDYVVALIGDSGNLSPPFTITNGTTA